MGALKSELIYFSPTGTTKKILENIVLGEDIKYTDLTVSDFNSEGRKNESDLVYIGGPVYAGRLPEVMVSRLRQIKGNGSSAVLIVMYGNREYDDALLELRDIAVEIGFKPVAAAAFIGEHSFSTKELPIAHERPDSKDLIKAEEFKNMLNEKIKESKNINEEKGLNISGNFPYKEIKSSTGISPDIDDKKCIMCGKCTSVCPTGAIDLENKIKANCDLCIKCNACIKICPTKAIDWKSEAINNLKIKLNENCKNRKEPEFFL
jgi:ferredoxin